MLPEYKTSQYGKYELHSWVKDGKKHENAAFFQPDVIVFGTSLDEVKAALDVLDGTKPNIAAKAEGLVAALPPGTILVAGAHDLGEADLPVESPLSKQADSVAGCRRRASRRSVRSRLVDGEGRRGCQADQDRRRRRSGLCLVGEDGRPRRAEIDRRGESDLGRQGDLRRGAGPRR